MKLRFVIVGLMLCLFSYLMAQSSPPMPPHVSAMIPPPVPAIMPHIRKFPTNCCMIYTPPGKTAEMFQIGMMQTDELLEKVRTNRYNLYLVEFRDAPAVDLQQVLVTPDEQKVLESFRQGMPQHP